MPYKKLLHSAM